MLSVGGQLNFDILSIYPLLSFNHFVSLVKIAPPREYFRSFKVINFSILNLR